MLLDIFPLQGKSINHKYGNENVYFAKSVRKIKYLYPAQIYIYLCFKKNLNMLRHVNIIFVLKTKRFD